MNVDELLNNLKIRGFVPHYFEGVDEAQKFFLGELDGFTIGMGGSVTISQLDLYNLLGRRNTVYCHSFDKSEGVLKRAALARAYISGANAIAATGEIVNIDGRGNRVSSIIWGAERERVYIVAGVNKITPDLPSAILRAKNVAAPLNAQRLQRKTPCAAKGDKCYNCNSPDKICRVLTVLTNPTSAQTHVVLVGCELGY